MATEGDYIESVSGKSSLFKILVTPGSFVYRYDVSILQRVPDRRDIMLTKQSDSHTRNADALTCRKIIDLAYKQTNGFGTGHLEHEFCYDGKCVFYSLRELTVLETELEAAVINQEALDISIKPTATLTITLLRNAHLPVLDYSDFKDSLMDMSSYSSDHSVRTFLEMVTSEYLIHTGQYQHAQGGALYHTQPLIHDHSIKKLPGVQAFEGLKKGVRVVDEKVAWLVVDMLRSTFYASVDHQGNTINMAQVYDMFVRSDRDEAGRRRFDQHFRGVRLIVGYDTSRTIQFHSMSRVPVNDQQFYVEGASIPEFYKRTHNIDLQYSHYPGIHTSFEGIKHNIIYPLEVLFVLPGQAIPQERALPEFENSIRAAERYDFITKQIKLFSFGYGEKFLRKFGIKIQEASNDVTIHCRALPMIRVQGDLLEPPTNGSFLRDMKRAKFLHAPNLLHNWIVAFDERIPQQKIEDFVRSLLNTLKGFGVNLQRPHVICPVVLERLEEVFIECKKEEFRNDFILFIDDKANDSHGRLKLFEAKYKVLTQHVTLQAVELPQQTLKGISMKLNSKCYGLNFLPQFKPYMHDLDLEKNPDLLVIGYDVAHPTNASPKDLASLKHKGYKKVLSWHPSVVGVAANKNENLCTFSADFFYQESCREELSSRRLEKAVSEIIECSYYSGLRAGVERKPTRLFIIRDGISEGQYKMAIERELLAIFNGYKAGMCSIGAEDLAKTTPPVTFMIATKRHNKRFFRVDSNGRIQNTQPGDVVNDTVVRKDVIDETFFQTHNAIKGTAQLTQYTVLLNDLQIPMLKIQEFMLTLSFMHQVSACPTSLPLPVYLADETAKRGMQIYQEWNKLATQRRRKGDNSPLTINEAVLSDDLTERFDQLTEELHYGHSALVDTRYNS